MLSSTASVRILFGARRPACRRRQRQMSPQARPLAGQNLPSFLVPKSVDSGSRARRCPRRACQPLFQHGGGVFFRLLQLAAAMARSNVGALHLEHATTAAVSSTASNLSLFSCVRRSLRINLRRTVVLAPSASGCLFLECRKCLGRQFRPAGCGFLCLRIG